MSYSRILALLALTTGLALSTSAQEEPVFEVVQMTDHIYKLSTDGGGYTVKVIASVGDDGILLVDAGQKRTAEDLKAILESRWNGSPKIIISTHEHVEHIGGTAVFGADPVVIGHSQLRTRLRSGSYLFDEFTDETLPAVTFTDSMSVFFNGEEIKLIALPGGHSDNDIMVWFTESKIACVGAISNGKHFPSVDGVSGDVLKYAEIAQRAIDILPDDVTIIPGHGEDGTMDEFRAFHEMLVRTMEIVRAGVAEGKDLATLQEEDVLKDWKSFEGSYTDANQWIKYLVEGYNRTEPKKLLYEPIYYALRDGGVEAGVEQYFDLKRNHPDEYKFNEIALVMIAYKLYQNDRMAEAVRFFDLCVEEYPEGSYAALAYDYQGRAYEVMGDTALALESYRRSLAIDSTRTHAAERVQELSE